MDFGHSRSRDTAVVVLPMLFVSQRFVRELNLPEHLLGNTITRIDARVIAPRQTPVRALDLIR
jgi:hypothetical protein